MFGTMFSATGLGEATALASKQASKSKSSSSKKEKTLSTSLHDNVFSFLLLEDFALEAGLEAEPRPASQAPVALLVVPPDIKVTPNCEVSVAPAVRQARFFKDSCVLKRSNIDLFVTSMGFISFDAQTI